MTAEATPEAGSVWAHYNGTLYRVLFITNEAYPSEKYPPTVVYANLHNANKYSRRLDDWHRSMTLVPDYDTPGHGDRTMTTPEYYLLLAGITGTALVFIITFTIAAPGFVLDNPVGTIMAFLSNAFTFLWTLLGYIATRRPKRLG